MKIEKNFSIKKYNTFKLDCVVKEFVTIDTENFDKNIFKDKFFILGNGSNILCPEYYDGVIIKYVNKNIVINKNITAYSAVLLNWLCLAALKNSLTGLEWAYGIPGTVGGAVYMNAGAYGGEIANVLKSVYCYNFETHDFCVLSNKDCKFSYRNSIFMNKKYFILSADFDLKKGDPTEIKAKMNDNLQKRKDKQPMNLPSAGSFFKRPVSGDNPVYAAALIEQCGLKGYKIGDAMVSEKHAGFIVNVGKATLKDILSLAEIVQKTVKDQTGYWLELEPEVLCSPTSESL
ncbi:UDP-N-acetylenolpyruvoylglucosamine reductase [Clostridia bacterium]|nr:UDP-N-acetylenolpyruvoylglucosamine reductase [Clostridia bacterium]